MENVNARRAAVRSIDWLGDFAWLLHWCGILVENVITRVKHSVAKLAIDGFEPSVFLAERVPVPVKALCANRQIPRGLAILGEDRIIERLERTKCEENAGDALAGERQADLISDESSRRTDQLLQIRCAFVWISHTRVVLVT